MLIVKETKVLLLLLIKFGLRRVLAFDFPAGVVDETIAVFGIEDVTIDDMTADNWLIGFIVGQSQSLQRIVQFVQKRKLFDQIGNVSRIGVQLFAEQQI